MVVLGADPGIANTGLTLDTDEFHKGCLDEIQFVEFSGESPLDYVRSMNSYRRHLSPSQSAAIVLKHSEMLKVGDNQIQLRVCHVTHR